MRKLFLLLVSIVFLSAQILAQSRQVTGRVTDEEGNPVANASVMVKGTQIGTSTDEKGAFSFNVPTTAKTLVISRVGYEEYSLQIGQGNNFSVVLKRGGEQMQEVVVIGYGTQSARNVTTAVSSIKADEITNVPVASVTQALQGKMPGVQVSATSGRPGSPIFIAVRGRSSINAGNDPLYVIDGVPVSNSQDILNLDMGQNVSPLANLNPEDIASIDVLKDAAAAAIYGSRGSNGVVIITTKKGASGGESSSITLNAYYGFQSIVKQKELLNASEYRQLYNESLKSEGITDGLYTDEQIRNPEANVDWMNEILKKNPVFQNYQVAASGGNNKTQYYASLGLFMQDGLLQKQHFDRYSLRVNLDHKFSEKLKFGTNINIARTERDETSYDNSIYSPWPRSLVARPDQPIYEADGSYAINAFHNPVQMFEPDMNINISNVLSSVYAEYEIIEGLTFKSLFGVDYYLTEEKEFFPMNSFQGLGPNREAWSTVSRRMNYVATQTLNYKKYLFDDRLHLDALAVYEFQSNQINRINAAAQDFPADLTTELGAGAKVLRGETSWTGNTLESMLARVNLSWEDKYLLGASIRRDGSSKFPKGDRYGIFPSVSVGWNIAEEKFMQDQDIFSLLKIRASYGETGNQFGIADFGYMKTFIAGANYNDKAGLRLKGLGSPDLRWESTKQTDIGLEIGFLKNRINVSIDYYSKKTNDMLIAKPIPPTTGFRTRLENIGNMEGTGWDFAVNSTNFSGDFNWKTTLTLSTYTNKVTKLYESTPINGDFVTRIAEGQPMGVFFLNRSLGVDPQTGDMMYEDFNKNGSIEDGDRQYIGSPLPKLQGGLNNELSYKGFDLMIFFQGAFGQSLYKMYEQGLEGAASLGAAPSVTNIFKEVWDNRWTTVGQQSSQPRVVGGAQGGFNTNNSTRFLEKASYVRLKNITLGYTLPNQLLSKAKIKSARVYISGQNLLTFTGYSGFDPEITTDPTVWNYGVDMGAIPQMKSVQLGLSIKF